MPTSETGKGESGLTLLEILAVLILIGLFTALVFPNFFQIGQKKHLQLITDLFQADLGQVKEEAMTGRTRQILTFTSNGYYFQIGENEIQRTFDNFKIVMKDDKEQDLEATINETEKTAETGEPLKEAGPSGFYVTFDPEGLCNSQQVDWESCGFKGALKIAEDGTAKWTYESQHK